TLHTYHNMLRILCQAFQIEFEGHDHRCERLLVQEAFRIHRAGQMLVPVIDEEIRSRVTYSVVLPRLSPETIEAFILGELDRAALGHNTFSPEALALIV